MPDKIPVERSRGRRLWAFYPVFGTRFCIKAAHFYSFHHSHLLVFFFKHLCLHLLFPSIASAQTCPLSPFVFNKIVRPNQSHFILRRLINRFQSFDDAHRADLTVRTARQINARHLKNGVQQVERLCFPSDRL